MYERTSIDRKSQIRVMSSSNYNVLYTLLVARERKDQIKWRTDSKVAPKDL